MTCAPSNRRLHSVSMEADEWGRVLGRLAAAERSQAWLARHLGLPRRTLNRYVLGQRSTPSDLAERIAAVLDLRDHRAA